MTDTFSNNKTSVTLRRDVPDPKEIKAYWGSDGIAELLQRFDIPYVCLNPGSSFRGLHDSLVNYNGNQNPQMVLCLHEEHAVSIAHGYAKVTGKPLAVVLHSNVGLMHGSMAIYNAYCDRVPMLILGAHGPVDASKRRPWIDWIHTSQDAGAMVRSFVKWDDQPVSLDASYKSILRARQMTETSPKAPVYVCLDVTMQETPLDAKPQVPDAQRFLPSAPAHPAPDVIAKMAQMLKDAKQPALMIGRVSRDEKEWQERVRLAERLNAIVFTDFKTGASFPTDHPSHKHPPATFFPADAGKTLKTCDVILALEWIELPGPLKAAWGDGEVGAKIITVSLDQALHNGASLDHHDLAPSDLFVAADQGVVVRELLAALGDAPARAQTPKPARQPVADDGAKDIHIGLLADALRGALADTKTDPCLIRLPLSWAGEMWDFKHPLDYLGGDGGAGIGSGPGMAVGAAMALKDSDRLPVAMLGDGDFLMGNTAIWSAATLNVPLLVIVANNQSFFNDEIHQERMARDRDRPVQNKWIGQHIGNPRVDLAGMARSQGFEGMGPVKHRDELRDVLKQAIAQVKAGKQVLVDVDVRPGYALSMSAGMTQKHG
ncbi:MAG: thiamine pyrophosphate protein binding domain protein [Noviherbaspirillum sp.]|nr:thiamine pyrophosphate protein binding domain protein [Noviherbaspirillum sp.]